MSKNELIPKEAGKKYRLIGGQGPDGLYRIQAVREFRLEWGAGIIRPGDLGGCVAGEHNLSHKGNCWIDRGAKVADEARVEDDALVLDHAQAFGRARVYGCARLMGYARAHDESRVSQQAQIKDHAEIFQSACISDGAVVGDYAKVYGDAQIFSHAEVKDYALVSAGVISGNARVNGWARVEVNIRAERDVVISINPVVLDMLPYPIIIFDNYIKIKCYYFSKANYEKEIDIIAEKHLVPTEIVRMYKKIIHILIANQVRQKKIIYGSRPGLSDKM